MGPTREAAASPQTDNVRSGFNLRFGEGKFQFRYKGKQVPYKGRLGCEMVDLDWMVPMDKAREVMGETQVLSGNMDPLAVLRDGTKQDVLDKTALCHQQCGDAYIIAAGCEITRDTPHENVHALKQYAESNS